MRSIRIIVDTPKFQEEMKRSGNGALPAVQRTQLAALAAGATILIGNNTPKFGGGLSGTGYVMQGGKATHSVGLHASEVQSGELRLP